MKQLTHQLEIDVRGKGLHDITKFIEHWVEEQALHTGLLTVFIPHTSASLLIQENADPDVLRDLKEFFNRIVPEDERLYRHTTEGRDDMPAHIRSTLTQAHLSIPIRNGRCALGTWQGIYLFEHRTSARRRSIILHLLGEA
jgi:secondary thiamine-phosphate synthase enzyme